MLDIYGVTFFGHRRIEHGREIEEKAFELICEILRTHQYVEFFIGRDGDFDLLMASVIRKAKKHVGSENSSMIWVLPYLTADFQKNENEYYQYYDNIEICEDSAAAHPKSAFRIRNRSMIDCADLVVFYMEHESGGTYEAWKYAKECGKTIINLI